MHWLHARSGRRVSGGVLLHVPHDVRAFTPRRAAIWARVVHLGRSRQPDRPQRCARGVGVPLRWRRQDSIHADVPRRGVDRCSLRRAHPARRRRRLDCPREFRRVRALPAQHRCRLGHVGRRGRHHLRGAHDVRSRHPRVQARHGLPQLFSGGYEHAPRAAQARASTCATSATCTRRRVTTR